MKKRHISEFPIEELKKDLAGFKMDLMVAKKLGNCYAAPEYQERAGLTATTCEKLIPIIEAELERRERENESQGQG